MRKWRNKNREHYNEYHRKLRAEFPDRYKEYEQRRMAKKKV